MSSAAQLLKSTSSNTLGLLAEFEVRVEVPEKEWERSDKHSAIGRDIEFRIFRRPFGPQPQVCWTFVMSLRFLRALP